MIDAVQGRRVSDHLDELDRLQAELDALHRESMTYLLNGCTGLWYCALGSKMEVRRQMAALNGEVNDEHE